MHIPDGFLSTPVWATLNAASLPAVGLMARRARVHEEDSRIPLLGTLGAFVFAAQMVNFPVGAGTSGHLVGGTLLACTLGPASAGLVMTAVLVVQAFLFQDGGVLALGANVVSMAVLGVLAGYLPYQLWGGGRGRRVAIFLGGTFSVLTSAAAALAFLFLSGITLPPALMRLPLALFLVTGLLEGLITVLVIEAIERIDPNWIRQPDRSRTPAVAFLGVAALVLACGGFAVASSYPDGLTRLGSELGLAERAVALFSTPLADYQATFPGAEWLQRIAAGIAGLSAAFLLCMAAGRLLAARKRA
ncbi:MAG TPA: energy-coupling factor ABC transporter permease [Bryobacteraceae bacterium]|nr:energy-coupling factor ABC transporter permease [Bryobacteraceae bacterium]